MQSGLIKPDANTALETLVTTARTGADPSSGFRFTLSTVALVPYRDILGIACLLVALIICAPPLRADVAPSAVPTLISFDFGTLISSPAPSLSSDARSIRISGRVLAELQPGDRFLLEVPGLDEVALTVLSASAHDNGDLSIQAVAVDHGSVTSLTLTAGIGSAFGYFAGSSGTWQIVSQKRLHDYAGWLFKPGSLAANGPGLQNDYLIVESENHAARPVPRLNSWLSPELPLLLSSPTASNSAVFEAGIDDSNFLIEQRFARNPVLVGSTAEAQVSFQNISSDVLAAASVEFYFLLENSQLLAAPEQCSEELSASLQRVLFCQLGDFAPGETKTLNYFIQTDASSQPVIYSTAIVGDARSDAVLNVVEDVVSDSDGDGVSDFNERRLGTDPLNSESVDDGPTTIDVLALFTEAAAAQFDGALETRINQLFNVANQIYVNSQVNIVLRPVHISAIDGLDGIDMETGLNQLLDRTHPYMAEIDMLRDRYGADLVAVFRTLEPSATRCGLAPVGGFNTSGDFSASHEKDMAFAVMALDCPHDIVVAHEFGHNMGLTHSHFEDGAGGTFDFSTGYGVRGQFVTIMAAPAAFATENRVPQFSDPQVECLGFLCGEDQGSEFGADAVSSLNTVRHQVAAFKAGTVQLLPEFPTQSTSPQGSGARAFLGASSDAGLSVKTEFAVGEALDVFAELLPDRFHVGEFGAIHAAVAWSDGRVQQIDNSGSLVDWDGSPESLIALGGLHQLSSRENLRLLRQYQVAAESAGQSLAIYFAYRVPVFFNELIFTATPLLINLTEPLPESLDEPVLD